MNIQDPTILAAIIGATVTILLSVGAAIFSLVKWRAEKRKLDLEIEQLQTSLGKHSDRQINIAEIRQGMLIISRKLWEKGFRPDVIISFTRSGIALAGMLAVNIKVDEVLSVSRHRDKVESQSATAKRKYIVGDLLSLNATRLKDKKILILLMLMETGDTIEDGLQYLRKEGLMQDLEVATMYITSGARNRWPNAIFAYETTDPKGVLQRLPWIDEYDFV